MTKYLIDSNAIIDSCRDYYRPGCFPKVWDELAKNPNVFMIEQVYNELVDNDDFISKFVVDNFKSRVLSVSVDKIAVLEYANIQNWLVNSKFWTQAGYTLWSESSKADPWLIATAKAHDFVIVSHERSRPKMNVGRPSSKEPKITTVASHFKIEVITIYNMLEKLNFTEA